MYEIQDEAAFRAQGDVQTQIHEHEQAERQRMAEADVLDKDRAKQKRQEKRRRMKEMERLLAEKHGVRARTEDDYGNEAEVLDLVLPGEEDEEEEEEEEAPRKRAKTDLASQEDMALRLLGA